MSDVTDGFREACSACWQRMLKSHYMYMYHDLDLECSGLALSNGKYYTTTPPFPPDFCYLSDAPCQMNVWWELTDVWWGMWQASDIRLTRSTRQIATVWWIRWYKEQGSQHQWENSFWKVREF